MFSFLFSDEPPELNRFGSLPIFRAPFKLQQSTTTKSYRALATELQADIRSLREELAYAQHALYEFEEKSDDKVLSKNGCDPNFGIPKCQVSRRAWFLRGRRSIEIGNIQTLIKLCSLVVRT